MKNRAAFANDESICKIMYLAINKASQKWTQTHMQLGLLLISLLLSLERGLRSSKKLYLHEFLDKPSPERFL